jgi:hypothetical protein
VRDPGEEEGAADGGGGVGSERGCRFRSDGLMESMGGEWRGRELKMLLRERRTERVEKMRERASIWIDEVL